MAAESSSPRTTLALASSYPVAERREQRGVRRWVEGGEDGRDHRQRIHDPHRAAYAHDDRHGTCDDPTHHGDQDEHPIPAAPVRQWRQQRGEDRGRSHPKKPHQPDSCRAAGPVGHDPETHRERRLGRSAPKKLICARRRLAFRALLMNAPAALPSLPANPTPATRRRYRPAPGSARAQVRGSECSARTGAYAAGTAGSSTVTPWVPGRRSVSRYSPHGSATASSWSACASRHHRGGCSSTEDLPTPGRCSRPGWPRIRASTSP